jgi:hypothetical protein
VPCREEAKEAIRQLQMNFRQNWQYPLECLFWHWLLTLQKCCRTEVSVFIVFQLCYIILKFMSPKLLSELKMKVMYGIIQCLLELMPAFCLLWEAKKLHEDVAFKPFATQ